MSKYGVFSLSKLVLQYSRNGGSSRGLRAYIETSLPKLKADNPQLNLSCSGLNNPAVHPQLYAAYRNGRRKSVCVKNYQPAEIHTAIHWLKDSHGRGQEDKVISKRQLSRNPSIQGMWSPAAFPEVLQHTNAARLQMMTGKQ
mmetsp:Transcript_10512/g.28774  ORF Transcript_10512/g.28774 Transcript_10512/m.28774 type:complete len:142 (+) Transcript_10512:1343-1768(+)